jgi:hypothetical protein
MYVTIDFAGGQITQAMTVISGCVVAERKVSVV